MTSPAIVNGHSASSADGRSDDAAGAIAHVRAKAPAGLIEAAPAR